MIAKYERLNLVTLLCFHPVEYILLEKYMDLKILFFILDSNIFGLSKKIISIFINGMNFEDSDICNTDFCIYRSQSSRFKIQFYFN